MKCFSFLLILAVHVLYVSSESEDTATATGKVDDETRNEEFLISKTDRTRTRLTAFLHEEFVIFQCLPDGSESESVVEGVTVDPRDERIACCDWIVKTASKLLPPDDDHDAAAWTWTTSLCVRHLAAVPSTENILNSTSSISSSSTQVVDVEPSHIFLYPRRTQETANGIFPPLPSPPSSLDDVPTHSWQHFIWRGETSETGEWITDERRPTATVREDNENDTTLRVLPKHDAVTASLESTLSETGGMHRDFHHAIRLGNVPNECQTTGTCTFSLSILLYVTADCFINTEDAFSATTDNNSNNLIHFDICMADDGNELIDQEEPAFVGPWHVVRVHVHGPLLNLNTQQTQTQPNSQTGGSSTSTTSTTSATIEWDTLLHIRYPMPVANRDYARIHVLAPQLVDGALQLQLQSESADNTNASWKIEPNEFQKDPSVLSTWVAVGREEDYPWVLGSTLAAATVGAAVMLRDLSRVACWD
jgi:hypothetical protein